MRAFTQGRGKIKRCLVTVMGKSTSSAAWHQSSTALTQICAALWKSGISAQCFCSQALLTKTRPYSRPARAGLSPSCPYLGHQKRSLPCACWHTPDGPPSCLLSYQVVSISCSYRSDDMAGAPPWRTSLPAPVQSSTSFDDLQGKGPAISSSEDAKHCSSAAAGKSHIQYRHLTLIRLLLIPVFTEL